MDQALGIVVEVYQPIAIVDLDLEKAQHRETQYP
jgi:hypothetical protein